MRAAEILYVHLLLVCEARSYLCAVCMATISILSITVIQI